MPELNKEIINAIKDLDSNKDMKNFLEVILEYELDQTVNDKKDGVKVAGNRYKQFIAKYAK